MTNINKCLFCNRDLGLRRFTGAIYCCDAHLKADELMMSLRACERLRASAGRLRAALAARDELPVLKRAS